MCKIAGFQLGVKSTELKPLTEEQLIRFLTTNNFSEQVKELNEHREKYGKDDKFDEMKEKLPAIAFAGWFTDGVRKQSHIETTSGLLLVDIDGDQNPDLSHESMLDVLEELKEHPSTYYADLSSSGKGIHCFLRIPKYKGTPDDIRKQFTHAFRVVNRDFIDDFGIFIDRKVSGVQSVKFIGINENPYINTDAVVYNIPEYVEPEKRETSDKDRCKDIEGANKFLNALLERGIYMDDERVLYSDENVVRHEWIVKCASALYKTFDLKPDEFKNLLLPIADLPTSKGTASKTRRITKREISNILSWCEEMNWDSDETYVPKAELPWKDKPYNFEQ